MFGVRLASTAMLRMVVNMVENMVGVSTDGGIVLTRSQLRSRKSRNVAIVPAAGVLVSFFFYVLTIIRLGPHALDGGR